MINIQWQNKKIQDFPLYFDDLELNEAFKINTGKAVYIKVGLNKKLYIKSSSKIDTECMYEIATGKLYPPTNSPVVQIGLEMIVNIPKPSIY
jgi:hypothetical protein